MCDRASEDKGSGETLSILTYNVFIGPVCPICPGIPRLLDSARLRHQIEEIQRLSPDIIFLQEVYCHRALGAYTQSLSSEYDASFSDGQLRKFGWSLWCALLPVTASIFLCLMWLVVRLLPTTGSGVDASSLAVLGPALTISCLLAWLLWRRTVPHSFCTGDIVAGIAVLHKRSKLKTAGPACTEVFSEQRGDVLNSICPRGFQVVQLVTLPTLVYVNLVHVHTNCMGSPSHRTSQVSEAIDKASAIAKNKGPTLLCGDFNCDANHPSLDVLYTTYQFLDSFLQAGGAGSGATWADDNRLTKGFMGNYPDLRCDLILCKPSDNVEIDFVRSNLALQGNDARQEDPPSDHYGLISTMRLGTMKLGMQGLSNYGFAEYCE